MSAGAVLADIALATGPATAAVALFRGWRNRTIAAAQAPFLTGHAAVEEAETALRFKNQRIADLTESEASLKQQLAAVKGAADAQQGQITQLESKLYRALSDNRELSARLETTERREREATERIGLLEDTVEDLKRKLALGGGPSF